MVTVTVAMTVCTIVELMAVGFPLLLLLDSSTVPVIPGILSGLPGSNPGMSTVGTDRIESKVLLAADEVADEASVEDRISSNIFATIDWLGTAIMRPRPAGTPGRIAPLLVS